MTVTTSAERMSRKRKHEKDIHDECMVGHCPVATKKFLEDLDKEPSKLNDLRASLTVRKLPCKRWQEGTHPPECEKFVWNPPDGTTSNNLPLCEVCKNISVPDDHVDDAASKDASTTSKDVERARW